MSAAAAHEGNWSYRDVLRNRHAAGLLLVTDTLHSKRLPVRDHRTRQQFDFFPYRQGTSRLVIRYGQPDQGRLVVVVSWKVPES